LFSGELGRGPKCCVHAANRIKAKASEKHADKVKELRAEGKLNEALQGAAQLAQDQISHLKRQGYPEWAAREVALPQFILLKPAPPAEDDEQERELREMEAEYRRNPPIPID
jgi:hypothetical protein